MIPLHKAFPFFSNNAIHFHFLLHPPPPPPFPHFPCFFFFVFKYIYFIHHIMDNTHHHALFINKCSSTLPPRYSYDLQQRRRNSLQPPSSRQRPLSLSLTNRTDLNNRIADSFQEFSTMLQQYSVPQPKTPPPQKRTVNPRESRWSVASLPSVSSTSTAVSSSSSSAFSLPVSPTTPYTKVKPVEPEQHYQQQSNELSVHPLSNADSCNNKRGSKIVQRLVRAVCQGDLTTVNTIINKERTIQVDDSLNEQGWTCLMYAACFGQIPIARALLDDIGASIDLQDKSMLFIIPFHYSTG